MRIFLFFRMGDADAQLFQLLGVDGGGAAAHQLAGVLHLRESGDVPDVVSSAEEHRQAVQTDAHTAVGRRTVLVSIHKEAEFCGDLLIGETQSLEHPLLQLVVGDADGAAGQLDAVQH